MQTLRNTVGPSLAAIVGYVNALVLTQAFSTQEDPGIVDGTTDGNLQTGNAVDFTVDGFRYNKAATDDLFDLSGETDTIAAEYRAYWLYLDAAGTATIAAGANSIDEASALLSLPDLDETQSVIGVYIAGPATDFDGAAGLAAQGTVYDGIPAGVPGMPARPEFVKLIAP